MLLTYLIILIIAFLGLYFGLIIGYMAEEELKPGRKYFVALKHLLFLVILALFFIKNPSIIFIIFLALLIIIFSFSKYRETLYYFTLAVVFFLSWHFNGFALIAPLIFLYGFPVGSIYLYNHLKDKKKSNRNKRFLGVPAEPKKMILGMLKQYVGFVVVGFLLGIIGLFL